MTSAATSSVSPVWFWCVFASNLFGVTSLKGCRFAFNMGSQCVGTRYWFENLSTDSMQFDVTLLWRINGRDSVSNHQPHDCLLNRLFRRRSKKTSKLFVTGLCAGNSPGTGEFPAQMASNAENVSIWWRHHDLVTSDWIRCQRPISLTIFHHTSNVIGIPFCYHPKSNARIATNVCTLHDSRAVQKFVAISQPGIYLQWKEISIEFDLWWKKR